MKKFWYGSFLFLFAFFCLILGVNAISSYVVFNDVVSIRKGPATTYDKYGNGQVGSTYNLRNNSIIPDEAKNGSCDAGWYEIDYNGSSAYVCSSYVSLFKPSDNTGGTPTTACEIEMQAAGFPSSYWGYLCSLKEQHPNWVFKSVQTNLDWTTAVNKFTNCGDALVENPKSEWKDTSCSYSEGAFKPVNQTGVAYYLDPRNFLSEQYIFQFENNRFNSSLKDYYTDASRTIISGANFYKYHLNLGNDLPTYLSSGGLNTNVSSTHLASRMYQELGTTNRTYNLYSGVFYGEISYAPANTDGTHLYDFRGYYNFYNIGVTGYCVNGGGGATYCGLKKAISYGWDSVAKAVQGGGDFLNSNYLNLGQYTSYFERFNVVPTNPNYMYIHYYMANLAAPSREALSVYNAYKKNNLLDKSFEFFIPVYSDMTNQINNSNNGANNDNSNSSPSTTSVQVIANSAGLKLSGNYITGIGANTSADTVKANIAAVGGIAEVSTSGTIGTGTTIKISNSVDAQTFTVIIKGDTSGDGLITAKDLLQVQKNILGEYALKDAYKDAADTSRDGAVTAKDLLQIQKSILGEYTIN